MAVKEVAKYARKRFLSIQMARRESILHMQSLRRIHDSKLKLQKKLMNKIADDLSLNRVDILKKMFEMEMNNFFRQYDDLYEINLRQVQNEDLFIKVIRVCYFYRF